MLETFETVAKAVADPSRVRILKLLESGEVCVWSGSLEVRGVNMSWREGVSGKVFNVLFLCTGNSARSVMAECIMNRLGAGKFRAFSAGSRPTGKVNPLAIEVLRENGHSAEGLRSKSWDEFATPDAPQMDLVITVCDNAAGEVCPVWPGHPSRVHIGFPDPAAAEGSHEERLTEFRKVYAMIEAQVVKQRSGRTGEI